MLTLQYYNACSSPTVLPTMDTGELIFTHENTQNSVFLIEESFTSLVSLDNRVYITHSFNMDKQISVTVGFCPEVR